MEYKRKFEFAVVDKVATVSAEIFATNFVDRNSIIIKDVLYHIMEGSTYDNVMLQIMHKKIKKSYYKSVHGMKDGE